MNVELLNIADPPNKIRKNIPSSGDSYRLLENVIFKNSGNLSITRPILMVRYSTEISDYSKYNYMRIPKFGRYYFITDIVTNNGIVEIHGKSDPLTSFQKDILDKGQAQYITRSQSVQNRYLVDGLLPFESRNKYFVKQFGDEVYDIHCHNVLLETIGKGGVPVD